MDKETAKKLVEEYAKLVVQNMVVNKIVLYGSYARGDNRKNSDIDVAVIVPRESISKNILNDMAKLFKLTRNISTDLEPILLIDEEDASGFLEDILQYGEVVYSK
ncbi:MAG: nucleotidyltransferase domain-containing protein [Clostridia bacterium]|nr:nucleotidyltransferase domain-containing protein [Clostridia bacterium]